MNPKCEWRELERATHCKFTCPPRWSDFPCPIQQMYDFYYEEVEERRDVLSAKLLRLIQ